MEAQKKTSHSETEILISALTGVQPFWRKDWSVAVIINRKSNQEISLFWLQCQDIPGVDRINQILSI